jgi:hypothetical protein
MAQAARDGERDEAECHRDRQQRGKRRNRWPAQSGKGDAGAGQCEQGRQHRRGDGGAVERGGIAGQCHEWLVAEVGGVANPGVRNCVARMLIEFDTWKDATNFDKHGLSLAFDARLFDDPLHIVLGSIRPIDCEDRYKIIGMVDGKL